ncbi:Segregation and condensation protein B [Thermobacillus xylanilyticus]|jgi:segregation and condensation protein B|uniref:Segregation and condensation protein B n=1 Tax=Thermobacillus xylanilyticus TaxID=76633 RepID=A0ABM8V697_THEXY|nr:Segregation and condensation protein B [Thermobacillus xylanilyticus]
MRRRVDYKTLKSIIEGLLFMAGDEGISAKQLGEILGCDPALARDAAEELKADMVREGRGLRVAEVAGGYRLTTVPEHAPYFEKLAYTPGRQSLSQAALETLAIIAYRQPITRVEIEEIRGVKSDRALQSLVNKELIQEVGRADAIGRPILYGTTKAFLDYFGLPDLSALPEPEEAEQDLLAEQTQMLFEKLDSMQMTLDEFRDEN